MLNRRVLLANAGAASIFAASGGMPLRAWSQANPTPEMIVHRGFPLNAEPRSAKLAASFITAQPDFYIRCHGTIPQIAAGDYKLKVGGQGATTPFELSLSEMRSRFPERKVTAVMQCAGNRRSDMAEVKHVSGDGWGPGAISNAEWSGVALADVLKAAGAPDDSKLHVAFACHDDVEEDGERFKFGVSIPMPKAIAPETILAFAMNGEPLTAEHGFPVRVVVPGFAGVRSPKWLASITVQDSPSDSPIQAKNYKLFPPSMTKETVDFAQGVTIDDMPLNSAICEPAEGAKIAAGAVAVRGYAIATGRPIVRVDVSADEGKTWLQADLDRHADAPWSWTLWSTKLDLPKGEHELVVRAWDAAGDTQSSSMAEIWNFPGYLSTAWHRVKVQVG